MNIRTGICIFLTLLIILSSFTVADSINITNDKCEINANPIGADMCPVRPINVTKQVWDSSIDGWVDYYYAELSETVVFNITITYHKNCPLGKKAKDIQVIDNLPFGLKYLESTPFHESFIEGNLIYWNLSEDYDINLTDKQSVSIEFEASVDYYGEHENYVEVFAFEKCCDYDLYGDANATVNCIQPDPSFEKKVKDTKTGEWVEETSQYVTEKVSYKIELKYIGNYNLTDVKIVDYLPEVTEFISANIMPTYISKDRRTVWWNITEPLKDNVPFRITFDAYVWGSTGDCEECGTNLAKYTAIENVTQIPNQGQDTAMIDTEYYDNPELAYLPNYINFGENDQGWTGSETFDIWNNGQQTLTFTISENLDWIEVTPSEGTSEGEHRTITISVVNTANISGFYSGIINISSNGGSGYVFVAINIQVVEPKELKVNIKRGLGRFIKVSIENTGNVDINDLTWTITVNRRGIIKRPRVTNGNFSILESEQKETIRAKPFGFGLITVKVNVTAPGIEPIEITAKGFIFIRFVRLRRFL